MNETIYVILKLLFDFALEVWFSIFHAITNDIFKLNYGTTHNISDLSYTCLDTLYSSS